MTEFVFRPKLIKPGRNCDALLLQIFYFNLFLYFGRNQNSVPNLGRIEVLVAKLGHNHLFPRQPRLF